jgi:hypothetical protein
LPHLHTTDPGEWWSRVGGGGKGTYTATLHMRIKQSLQAYHKHCKTEAEKQCTKY